MKSLHLHFILLFCVSLAACSSQRHVTSTLSSSSSQQSSELSTDSVGASVSDSSLLVKVDNVVDKSYERTTEFDAQGNIVRIIEYYHDVSQLTSSELTTISQIEWFLSKASIISVSDSAKVASDSHNNISTDTRPLQGFEWVWFIIATAFVIILAIVTKKLKIW